MLAFVVIDCSYLRFVRNATVLDDAEPHHDSSEEQQMVQFIVLHEIRTSIARRLVRMSTLMIGGATCVSTLMASGVFHYILTLSNSEGACLHVLNEMYDIDESSSSYLHQKTLKVSAA